MPDRASMCGEHDVLFFDAVSVVEPPPDHGTITTSKDHRAPNLLHPASERVVKSVSSKSSPPVSDFSAETDCWHTYTSDEEAVSPVDNDDISMGSLDSDVSSLHSWSQGDSQAGEQCSQAQCVEIQHVGVAKTVSRPRLIHIPARRSMMQPISTHVSSPQRPSSPQRASSVRLSRSARSSQESHSRSSCRNSVTSVSPQSPASTAPSSMDDEDVPQVTFRKTLCVSRHVDLMEAARRQMAPASPAAPAWTMTPTLSGPALPPADATAQPKARDRRKNRFSTNFALNRLGKTFTRRDSHDVRDELENVKEPEAVMVIPEVPPPHPSGRRTRTKLVARGADERAPPITLPPVPTNYSSSMEFPWEKAHESSSDNAA